jgi:ParB-like chromosome segregation protein Spo0J
VQQQVVYRTREMQRIEAEQGRPIEQILRELRIEEGLTVEQVGSRLGVTKSAASRWLERFAIYPARKSAI